MILAVLILAIVLPYMAVAWIVRIVRGRAAMTRLTAIAIEQTAQHAKTLVTKERQTVYEDEYGNYVFDDFNREIDRFVRTAVLRKARTGDHVAASRIFDVHDRLTATIHDALYNVHIPAAEAEGNTVATIPSHHKDFEHWCAQALRQQGWQARVVGGSGDQGADLIAEKQGIKLVVQCKRWSAAVGNTAVQEVAAARAHHEADQALVVSASGFTASARQLATTNDVFLVEAVELASMPGLLN